MEQCPALEANSRSLVQEIYRFSLNLKDIYRMDNNPLNHTPRQPPPPPNLSSVRSILVLFSVTFKHSE
jgi:hypothetical protein